MPHNNPQEQAEEENPINAQISGRIHFVWNLRVLDELAQANGMRKRRTDSASPRPAERIPELVNPLLRWYRRQSRPLPWRASRDPYAIWISEVMLQQTQVKTVLPYWKRWMRALPDLSGRWLRPPRPRSSSSGKGLATIPEPAISAGPRK